jgi:hypothetical protein
VNTAFPGYVLSGREHDRSVLGSEHRGGWEQVAHMVLVWWW